MPLVIEDGTGKADADSWVALEDADTYWHDRNVEAWTDADPTVTEAALRIAADYLTIAYRWPGQPTTLNQRLPWPRAGVRSGLAVFPSHAIPTQIITAQMLIAVEALTSNPLKKQAPDRVVTEETKSFKGISKTVKYATAPVDPVSGLQRYAVVDQLLVGLTLGEGSSSFGSAKLVKAYC